jgi:hypothetical protein
MKKRVACAFIACGLALSVAEACGFPDVQFAGDGLDAAGGGDAAGDGAGRNDGGAPLDPDVDPDGGSKDATTAGEAAVPIDAAGCMDCDCDNDGYNRLELTKNCDGGPPGKTDCDDLNFAIHPGQSEFFLDPWPASQHKPIGDWDCSGATTKQFPYDAACGLLSACKNGFVGSPACGATADFIKCGPVLPVVGCAEESRQTSGSLVQGCH